MTSEILYCSILESCTCCNFVTDCFFFFFFYIYIYIYIYINEMNEDFSLGYENGVGKI